LPGDKKEEVMMKDKTVSLDAQLAAVQAHIEDLEVRLGVYPTKSNKYSFTNIGNLHVPSTFLLLLTNIPSLVGQVFFAIILSQFFEEYFSHRYL
jgi:hypothetical protein